MHRVSGAGRVYSIRRRLRCGFWLSGLLLCGLAGAATDNVALRGQAQQGGLLIGRAPDAVAVWQDGEPVHLSAGVFLLGFGRDHPQISRLRVRFRDGTEAVRELAVARRDYRVQRIDGLPPGKVAPLTPAEIARIRSDVAAVRRARARSDYRTDFLRGFIWPVRGRISGVYGSQRVLNGEPKRPHFGVDIARPVGTPVKAPADGVVTLAAPDMFYSGGTLIIDHGQQLSSSFLHLSRLLVKVGQRVRQGEQIAEVGSTGRATGPHLDWRMNLRDQRLDPALLVPPMRWSDTRH